MTRSRTIMHRLRSFFILTAPVLLTPALFVGCPPSEAGLPDVTGLAVPGMPIGSPGMEGARPQSYDVVSFDRKGRQTVYAKR